MKNLHVVAGNFGKVGVVVHHQAGMEKNWCLESRRNEDGVMFYGIGARFCAQLPT